MEDNPASTLPFYLSAASIDKLPAPEHQPEIAGNDLETEIVKAGNRLESANGADFLLALAYLDYAVQWGRFSPGQLDWGSQAKPVWARIKEFRLFGPAGEYYVWRTEPDHFAARLRLDLYNGEGVFKDSAEEEKGYKPYNAKTPPDIVSEWLALWGTRGVSQADGWLEISEERGAKLLLPYTLESGQTLPLRVLVRHYLDYDDEDTGLVRFTDLRMVKVSGTSQEAEKQAGKKR